MTIGYEALRHGAGVLDLSARGRIVARGRDRAHFYAEGAVVSPELEGRDTTWGDYLRRKYVPGWDG